MEPLLKWPGSKRRVAAELSAKISADINPKGRYVELFAGSAALFFHMEPRRAVLVDINKPLIAFYEAVQREPNAFYDETQRLIELPHCEDTFLKIRGEWNGRDFGTKFAARLLYLNKVCFNGLFRLNKDLVFNVPWGKKENLPEFPSKDEVLAASELLRRAKLYHRDFGTVLRTTHCYDTVFCDPPYYGTFDGYAGGKFTDHDQQRLARGLKSAAARGVNAYATNTDCPEIRRLYEDWSQIETIKVLHRIGASADSRKVVDEILAIAKASTINQRQTEMFQC